MGSNKVWTRAFITLMAAQIIFFFGFYMLTPTLPLYTKMLGANDTQVGLITTFYSLACFVTRLSIGFLLQRFTRKTLLRIGVIVSCVLTAAYALTHGLPGVIVLRIIQGFGFGMVSTFCGAMAADALPDARRGEGMGYFGMGTTVAIAFSPTVGLAIANNVNFAAMFLAAAVILVVAAVSVSFVKVPDASEKKKAPAPAEEEAAAEAKPPVKDPFWMKIFDPVIAFPALLLLLYGICRGAEQNFIPLLSSSQGLTMLSVYFIVQTAVSFVFKFITGKFYDKYGVGSSIVPGGILILADMLVLSLTHGNAMLLLAGVFGGAGLGALIPAFQAWIMTTVGREKRNLGSAMYYNVYDIGIAVGSVGMGAIADRIGYCGMFRWGVYIMIVYLVLFAGKRLLFKGKKQAA